MENTYKTNITKKQRSLFYPVIAGIHSLEYGHSNHFDYSVLFFFRQSLAHDGFIGKPNIDFLQANQWLGQYTQEFRKMNYATY